MTGETAKKADTQVVFLIGSSRGGAHGDKRTVSVERAEEMVASGLARYPANKE